MPIESKAWDWKRNNSERWDEPSEISYYLVQRWKEKGFRRFLDLGCGPGRHSMQFARAGFDVTAFDLSPEAIGLVEDKAREAGLGVTTRCGDMRRLPFADASMDCLLAYHVISHTDTEGIREVLGEIRRVLRPGGELYLSFCSKKAWSFAEAGFERLDENTVVKREDGPEDGIPHFFVDEGSLTALLSDIRILSLQHVQDLVVGGEPYGSWHYFLLGER
jgi:SAM-dependent methyltransferase